MAPGQGLLFLIALVVLDTSTSSGTHTCCPKAQGCLSLIETNGEITQAAALNNGLHSHVSGSMVRTWEAGWGCCRGRGGIGWKSGKVFNIDQKSLVEMWLLGSKLLFE